MSEWNFQLFNEKLGNKIEFGVLIGKSLSGKSVVAKLLQDTQSYTILDMKQIADGVKAGLGSEEEPFEGEVPVADVEKAVTEKIKTC
jgi:dephospho-CoA kinase